MHLGLNLFFALVVIGHAAAAFKHHFVDKDDVLTESIHKAGFASQMEGNLTVVLDCNLTPDLVTEGYQREVVSKLQTMRKDAEYDVTDRITVTYTADAELSAAIEAGKPFIAQSVLAETLVAGEPVQGAYTQAWEINDKQATLSIQKA